MILYVEFDFCTIRSSDPVFLLKLYSWKKIKIFELIKKFVSIFSYSKEPHIFFHLYNFASASVTYSILGLFIRKHYFTAVAEIHICFVLKSKIMLEKLKENPLCPFIILLISCIYSSAPVERITCSF